MITFIYNLLDTDPKFVDAEHQNFRLKDDSPSLVLGFMPIPIEKIGLHQDENRASWPVVSEIRPMPQQPPVPR